MLMAKTALLRRHPPPNQKLVREVVRQIFNNLLNRLVL
jgi:hypothetical protein